MCRSSRPGTFDGLPSVPCRHGEHRASVPSRRSAAAVEEGRSLGGSCAAGWGKEEHIMELCRRGGGAAPPAVAERDDGGGGAAQRPERRRARATRRRRVGAVSRWGERSGGVGEQRVE